MTVEITYKVKSPDGYPDEFNEIKPGQAKTKRERQVVVSYARAIKTAEDEVLELLRDEAALEAKIVGKSNA